MYKEGFQGVVMARTWFHEKFGYVSVGSIAGGGVMHSAGRRGAEKTPKGGLMSEPCRADKKAHYGSLGNNRLENKIMIRQKETGRSEGSGPASGMAIARLKSSSHLSRNFLDRPTFQTR
jgi:hypothetical protein